MICVHQPHRNTSHRTTRRAVRGSLLHGGCEGNGHEHYWYVTLWRLITEHAVIQHFRTQNDTQQHTEVPHTFCGTSCIALYRGHGKKFLGKGKRPCLLQSVHTGSGTYATCSVCIGVSSPSPRGGGRVATARSWAHYQKLRLRMRGVISTPAYALIIKCCRTVLPLNLCIFCGIQRHYMCTRCIWNGLLGLDPEIEGRHFMVISSNYFFSSQS
jgi:hypothetical protein